MLYSIGKDSSVMLHLARRRSTRRSRRSRCCTSTRPGSSARCSRSATAWPRELGLELLVHVEPGGASSAGINPFTTARRSTPTCEDRGPEAGARHSTASTPRSAARAATRRSRAPRSASSRSARAQHRWDPKNQRPELWHLYNARKQQGESIRVFPLSNWTELDVWQYIYLEEHPDRAALLRRASARWSSATAR